MPVTELVSNEVETTLAAPVGVGDTTITVLSAAGFPAASTGVSQFRALLYKGGVRASQEIVLVTNVSGTTFTVTRAQEGTTAKTHDFGDGVKVILTAGGLTALLSQAATSADHNHTATSGDGSVLTNDQHDGYSEYAEIAAPVAPAADKVRVYARDAAGTSKLYYKRSDNTEVELGGGAGVHDHTTADGTGPLTNDEHDGYSDYANLGVAPAAPADGVRLWAESGLLKVKNAGGDPFILGQHDFQGAEHLASASTAAASAGISSDVTLVDATSANRTMTLPAVASSSSRWYEIKKIDSSANTVTIQPAAGDVGVTIDGAATVVLTAQYEAVRLFCNGSQWYSIAEYSSGAGGGGATNLDSLTDVTITTPSTGQVLKYNGSAWINDTDATGGGGGSGLYSAYICIRDEKAQNTAGGTFTAGAWQVRTLNTEQSDTGNHASLASNQITLAAGTYDAYISCPAHGVNRHKARLYNVTGAAVLLEGTSELASGGGGGYSRSIIAGRFTLAVQSVLEVQHQCQTTFSTNGFGLESNYGTEIYTVAEMWKVS